MNLENIKDIFDFDNFDYFYHETSVDRAKSIMQQGLLVDGTNILGTNNILFTTTCRISEDMVPTSQAFIDYVESEFGPSNIRDVSAMVILAADKSWEEEIVEPFGQYVDDHYYQGIIRPQ